MIKPRAGNAALLASPASAIRRLADVVPLDFLRKLKVSSLFEVDMEALRAAVTPFVHAPHKLKIAKCTKERLCIFFMCFCFCCCFLFFCTDPLLLGQPLQQSHSVF